MRKILIASLIAAAATFSAAAPASAQSAQSGVTANVSTTPNLFGPGGAPNLTCRFNPGSRACAESNRQAPEQRPSASNNRNPANGTRPTPGRPGRG